MKIAQIAPLTESCPPRLYGGTERVVAYLTDELVRAGHDVTLFASGDSRTLADLSPVCDRALRLGPGKRDAQIFTTIQLGRVLRRAEEFDVLHFHLEHTHFPVFSSIAARCLTTQHGRLDLPDQRLPFAEFPQMAQISISNAQRKPLPHANWVATVYHGLPRALHEAGDGRGGRLAFLGRICLEKGIERAIEIARRTNVPLDIAAKVDDADRDYFNTRVKHLIDGKSVRLLGEIAEREKTAFLGGALALLFPIDWPEPFGLVLLEAMACGTPVIAWRNGSVEEIVEEGVTGFVVQSLDQAVAAVRRAGSLDRKRIRQRFEQRFTADRMAHDYERVYASLGTGGTVVDPREVA